jgi:hypothetical protein
VTVDISATFTTKEQVRNGLVAIADQLTDHPLERRVVIGVVECIRTKIDHTNGGAETPVVKFVHIEPMLSQMEMDEAKKLLDRACRARTGRGPDDPLPDEDAPKRKKGAPMPGEQELPLELRDEYDDDEQGDDADDAEDADEEADEEEYADEVDEAAPAVFSHADDEGGDR